MDFEEIAGLINQVALAHLGRPLKDVERLVLKGSWENLTYGAMAQQAGGYSEDYLKKDVGPKLWHLLSELVDPQRQGIKVTKRNLKNVLQTWAKQGLPPHARAWPTVAEASAPSPWLGSSAVQVVRSAPAMEVTDFCGRAEDLAMLTQWITGSGAAMAGDPCRLVLLWGLPGMGKTALVGQLIHRLGPTMDRWGYLDLRGYPTTSDPNGEDILLALATWLDPDPPQLPASALLDWLLERVEQRRYLLVVDHLEVCFEGRQLAGHYRSDTEAFQHLIQRWATGHHRSCLVIASGEPPADRAQWMGPRARGYRLSDLICADTQALLQRQGDLAATADQWQRLWQRYGGHPLILRSLATPLHSLYQGDLSTLLAQPAVLLPDPQRHLLRPLFQRLTEDEQALLYWVALAQGPIALEDLRQAMPSYPGPAVVQSLVDRSLCHTQTISRDYPDTQVDLSPLVRTLVMDDWLERLATELLAEQWHWLHRLPLVLMTAQESVQATQRAALVVPLAQQLQQRFPRADDLAQACHQRLQTLRQQSRGQPGFSAANWLHLCQVLGVAVGGVDLSGLTLWQADLRQMSLQGANLSQVQFRETAFATALGRSPRVAFRPVAAQRSRQGVAKDDEKTLMVTGDQDGRLLLWEVPQGRLVQVMDDGEALAVQSLAFSPDGETLAVGSDGGAIWLWPVGSNARSDALVGHGAAVQAVAFSGDGTWLASGDGNGEIRLWDVASGRCLACWGDHQGGIHSLRFNGTHDRLISSGDDQATRLWDVAQGRLVSTFQVPATASVRAAGFLPDPHRPDQPALPVAAGYDAPCLALWNVETGRLHRRFPVDGHPLPALTLSPDGRYGACSCQDFSVVVWDIPARTMRYRLPPLDSPVWLLSFSPDGRYLVTGSDYRLHLWQAATGIELRRFLSQTHPVDQVAVSAGGTHILTGHTDQQVRWWPHQGSGTRRPQRLIGPVAPLRTIALSPDGQWCANASDDSTLHLWHSTAERPRWVAHVSAHLLAFSPNGHCLASAGAEASLQIWDVAKGERLRAWSRPATLPSALVFSHDGQRLISGSREGTIEVWPWAIPTADPLILSGHQRSVHSLASSADGQILASASHDGTVRWWDGTQGIGLGQWFLPDGHWVHSVTFDASGTVLAITSHGSKVAIWEVQSNRLRHTLRGHHQPLWAAVVSPDRTHLVTASQDHEIRLWHLALGRCQYTFHPDRPYAAVSIQSATGLSPSEVAILTSLGATLGD